ncbi:ecotropic viral integration site 5 ortholog [Etheostoma cragini]|uniref:ecotropic viral integration site 5 ortholog n=1 Tax=Etheostoma cragini TaxID=417921 RepID=UPI00155E06F6|nr:ecotropic viral integration site 5 ortholog [Etheostoma cragini]
MFSPTSPAQKDLSEEDSSGSDAGSEVGLEPETDRFGFILTNGSTAGSVGPAPELVRQRETKWINIISQWDRVLLKKTSKVKVQCQKGIPASLRAKCWPLLCGATDKMKQHENLYKSLDSQPALQSWVDVIERDLDRQFPFHEMFLSKDGHGQRGLFRVLKAYTQYQPEEGYCQAQGPVAAVLLMNMPAEEAFWCLVQISEQYLPGYYSPLLEGVLFDAAMLTWVLKRTCPAAHKHLQHHGVEPLMFATDWLMCLFTRHLPFNTLLRVWDLFFCYGVRVLLQVAVVLVRRVLGRAEQRKQCQGQMETLERLRGIRDEVQEGEDSFIAEVCSVQLSARDLEKHTEKELEKWRRDRPSSTFDPRGRCQGYRMAWARARQNKEERERKAREKGNLSVPLARSASTLSLSPSLLHKRWKKGGRTNTREREGNSRVVRHLSMGAKEDWRSWAELNFKKVQGVQEEEDLVLEEHKKQNEPKLTEQPEQKELLEREKMEIQNMPTEHVEETVIGKEQIEQVETRITVKEEPRLKESEESKVLSNQTEETNVETELIKDSAKDQTVENIIRPTDHKQGEELDSYSLSQVWEQSHNSKHLEIEVQDANKETEKQVEESEHTAAVGGTQTEIHKDAYADENQEVETQDSVYSSEEDMILADLKAEESTETENVDTVTRPGLETDSKAEAPAVIDPTVETETQQEQPEAITETDGSPQRDTFEEKYHSTESLAGTGMNKESHTQTETATNVLAQTQEQAEGNAATNKLEAEKVHIDSDQHIDSKIEAETIILCLPKCIQPKHGTGLVADTETEAEILVANDIVRESRECDVVASEPTQEEEERSLTAHSDAQVDNDQTETENIDLIAPPCTQAEEVTLTAEPDGKTISLETGTSEEPPPEQPTSQVTLGAVEEEESTENVQENPIVEDVLISTKPTDPLNTDSNPQVQEKDSNLVKDQTEPNNSSLTQASGHRSSRSSGDLCVRKSPNSRGSRLACRLSEDLFIMPEKTGKSQCTPNHPEVKHSESQSNPGAANPTPSPPDVTSEVTSSLSAEVTERTAVQQEQLPPPNPSKRFGLFRRLRGEQPKKAKGTPKIQVPKILIQDFSDGSGTGKLVEEEGEEKLSSRERRTRRRVRERREKEEEKFRKKREKELGKEKEQESRKPQTRGKSFQVQREKGSSDVAQHANPGSQTLRHSASNAESYF